MKRTRITDKITFVEPASMANFTSCSGIIVKAKKKVFIDMNMGAEETPGLVRDEKPDAAIITHYHLDHSIWTRYVNEQSATTIFIPEQEAPYLTSFDYVIEHTAGPFGMSEKWGEFVKNDLGYTPLESYECYNSLTSFKEITPEIVMVETPGHSPAHTSFYFPDEKILFSGDMGLDRFGPWYGWSDCNIKRIIDSILRLDGMDVNLVLTSHGGLIRDEIQKQWAGCIQEIVKRERDIIEKLDRGLDAADIIQQGVFFKEIEKENVEEPMRSFLYMWDTAMYQHHETLIHDGGLIKFFPEILNMTK